MAEFLNWKSVWDSLAPGSARIPFPEGLVTVTLLHVLPPAPKGDIVAIGFVVADEMVTGRNVFDLPFQK